MTSSMLHKMFGNSTSSALKESASSHGRRWGRISVQLCLTLLLLSSIAIVLGVSGAAEDNGKFPPIDNGCPAGQVLDNATGDCVPAPPGSTPTPNGDCDDHGKYPCPDDNDCPEGQSKDENGNCVPTTGGNTTIGGSTATGGETTGGTTTSGETAGATTTSGETTNGTTTSGETTGGTTTSGETTGGTTTSGTTTSGETTGGTTTSGTTTSGETTGGTTGGTTTSGETTGGTTTSGTTTSGETTSGTTTSGETTGGTTTSGETTGGTTTSGTTTSGETTGGTTTSGTTTSGETTGGTTTSGTTTSGETTGGTTGGTTTSGETTGGTTTSGTTTSGETTSGTTTSGETTGGTTTSGTTTSGETTGGTTTSGTSTGSTTTGSTYGGTSTGGTTAGGTSGGFSGGPGGDTSGSTTTGGTSTGGTTGDTTAGDTTAGDTTAGGTTGGGTGGGGNTDMRYEIVLTGYTSLEALKGTAVGVSVYAYEPGSVQRVGGKKVKLSATLGTLTEENIITLPPPPPQTGGGFLMAGPAANAVASASEADDPTGSIFKSDGTGGWAEITAEVGGTSISKTILCHRVRVKDFGQPKFLRYQPDSENAELAHPQMEFDIEDKPGVGTRFQVSCAIYSLEGHTPLTNRTWIVNSAGHQSKNWSDFFFPTGTPQSEWGERNLDPGEGIYPFQITVTCIEMDRDILDDHDIKYAVGYNTGSPIPTGSDWKASTNLTVKPRRQNAWSLSYDEDSDSTKLAYIADIHSADGKEPQTVRVDVYDPEMNKVGEVTDQTIEPTVVAGLYGDRGKTFTYYFKGPVNLQSAGDYHFVVEAQAAADEPDAKENKDAGKWALEQNSSAKVPTFVTFGGKSPGIDDPGMGGGLEKITGSTLDTSGVSIAAAGRLQRGGYKVRLPTPKPYWATDYRGVFADGFSTAQDVAANLNSSRARTKPIQYNAVWLYAGHGSGGNLMAVWDPATPSSTKASYGWDNTNWTYISANGRFPNGTAVDGRENVSLGDLQNARRGNYLNGPNGPFTNVGTGYVYPLYYARLVCFIGCDTANGTATDLPSKAVQLGATNAIGITQLCVGDNAVNITRKFFDYLEPSKNDGARFNVHQAAFKASLEVFRDVNVIKVAGPVGKGIFGKDFGWGGDGLGPEGK